jgi:integrase
LKFGKNEEKAEGYSPYTVYGDNYRETKFDRWVWDQRGGYHVPPTQEDASAYLDEIAYSDKTQTVKGKIQEMLKRYSKFLQHKYGQDEWEFSWSFDGSGGDSSQPRDYLTVEERRKIRQAALEKGSIPARGSLTADERKQWQGYIAQELDKPMDDITPEDWEKVSGWKITSMVWTSLDAGLRPVEVARARTSWVDTKNEVLRIPRQESSKNEGNWTVSLTERTARALKRWLIERDLQGRYDDTDLLWLTMRGNPYGSRTLARLLRNLCDDAGIEHENRKMTWYSIRHSVGTYMTKERDLAAAKAQLRHKSPKTTMKYDQTPVEDRQDALDKMG